MLLRLLFFEVVQEDQPLLRVLGSKGFELVLIADFGRGSRKFVFKRFERDHAFLVFSEFLLFLHVLILCHHLHVNLKLSLVLKRLGSLHLPPLLLLLDKLLLDLLKPLLILHLQLLPSLEELRLRLPYLLLQTLLLLTHQ